MLTYITIFGCPPYTELCVRRVSLAQWMNKRWNFCEYIDTSRVIVIALINFTGILRFHQTVCIVHWLLWNMNYVKEWGNYCDIVDCIRMIWSVPAAVPQMMKLMKHTVIWSLLLYWRLSTWIS